MAYFIGISRDGRQLKINRLEPGGKLVIGRAVEADLSVPEDSYISRKHAEVTFADDRLAVKKLPGARNPLIFRGEEKEEFTLAPGESFTIGGTQFMLEAESQSIRIGTESGPEPELMHTMSEADVFSGPGISDRLRLLDLLELPEILSSRTPAESYAHIASLLRMATGARWSAVATESGKLLARDSAEAGFKDFNLSRALVAAALKECPRPTLYCWSKPEMDFKATVQEGTDWAVCAAIKPHAGEPILFYVAGQEDTKEGLRENSRFVGLVAEMMGRSMAVSRLESWHGRLKQFFAGPVAEKILGSEDPLELKPRLADSTIMFFDIRGFSKRTEGQNDRILACLGELKTVMTAMTEQIFKENGVVLQYLGDGIMACWNVPFEDVAHVDRACRAALGMAAALKAIPGDWRCGIGVHTGQVVAGAIGSDMMFSYGVMGAVVNQTSRVEGITKAVETPILVSREVAEKVSPQVAIPMRIGRFQPAGMNVALDLYEPIPPPVDQARIKTYADGLAAFEKGEWEKAYETLGKLGPTDRPARFLMSLAESYRRRPPKDWKGTIELVEK